MNRKEFLKNCACGLCSCATVGLIAPETAPGAETKAPDDWRLPFVKQRYAKLLGILSSRMDEKTLNATLFELGAYCSGLSDEWKRKFRGDLEGYRKAVKQSVSGDNITYDWDKSLITMASDERTDCFCPLISRFHNTPKVQLFPGLAKAHLGNAAAEEGQSGTDGIRPARRKTVRVRDPHFGTSRLNR